MEIPFTGVLLWTWMFFIVRVKHSRYFLFMPIFFFRDYVFYFHTKGSLVDNLFISHSSFIFLKPFFLKLHNIIARTSVFACDVV